MQQKIYFAGKPVEVAHHAAPLADIQTFEIAEPSDIVRIAKPGDLVIFFSEHFDRFRDAIAKLKVKQVATLYMIDGILEWRNAWENRDDEPACPFTMRPVLSHKVACIGNTQARVLSRWGNKDKVEVVGVPRFDRFTRFEELTSQAKLVQPNAAEASHLPEPSKTVLVMTAKFPSYTETQHGKLVQSLKDLKSSFESRMEANVVWRLTAGLDQAIGVENQLDDLTGGDLEQVLSTVDAVISTPSTAILESMLVGLPTAVLDYTNSPSYLPVAWNITAADQIDAELSDLLNPPETKLFFQHCSLQDSLQLGEPASQRMGQLIVQMLATAKKQINGQQSQSLTFPPNMLPPPAVRDDNAFLHSEIYSSFAEFQSGDKIELQAELAHARREILHLQQQLQQIESELGRAHQIFDEINNHPIAGPVVKIRKRIISLLGKIKRARIQPEPH